MNSLIDPTIGSGRSDHDIVYKIDDINTSGW